MISNKKNIIITWPAHCFMENILPIINQIHEKYNIYYMTVDYDTPKSLISELEKLKKKQYLKEFYLVPKSNKVLKQIKFLNKLLNLKSLNFNVWLTMSETQLNEKFIKDNLLTNKCKKIILWTQITYLFENILLTKKLISQSDIETKYKKEKNYIKKNYIKEILKKNIPLTPTKIFILIFNKFYSLYKKLRKKIKLTLLDIQSRLLYKIYFNKYLNKGRYDGLTQLGSGEMDYILFTDAKEVNAHSNLFKNTKVELVNHTGRNLCKCTSKKIKKIKKILTPLSHPINVDFIPQDELDQYLNAFLIAKNEISFDEIHLRPHPRDRGNWSHYLNNFLKKNGINSKVVDTVEPIHSIICEYVGVIGESSCVLRDAANSCKFCFVLGIEKLSLHRYENPKFVFGEGQNINWIDINGSYDKRIFLESKNNYYNNIKSIYNFL